MGVQFQLKQHGQHIKEKKFGKHSQSQSYSESVVEHQYHRQYKQSNLWLLNRSQSEKRFKIHEDDENENEEDGNDDNLQMMHPQINAMQYVDAADPDIDDDDDDNENEIDHNKMGYMSLQNKDDDDDDDDDVNVQFSNSKSSKLQQRKPKNMKNLTVNQ